MTRLAGIVLPAMALAFLFLGTGEATAQQKHKFFFKPPPGTTKFTQTHILDVGDVPGHVVRIAEAQSKYADDAPVFGGVKVREVRTILASDYVAGTGHAFLYTVYTLENGDRIFSRGSIMAHGAAGADGGQRSSFTAVATLTGGTGKFKGIGGLLRTAGFSDLKAKTSGTQTEGEYWFEQ
jgi:hypothetical protein